MVEFSDSMLDKLAREYEPLKNKTISVDQANKLRKIFDRIPDRALDALRRKKIPFLSGLALSRMIKKGMPVKEEAELDEKYGKGVYQGVMADEIEHIDGAVIERNGYKWVDYSMKEIDVEFKKI